MKTLIVSSMSVFYWAKGNRSHITDGNTDDFVSVDVLQRRRELPTEYEFQSAGN
jgi:hypothetical protein